MKAIYLSHLGCIGSIKKFNKPNALKGSCKANKSLMKHAVNFLKQYGSQMFGTVQLALSRGCAAVIGPAKKTDQYSRRDGARPPGKPAVIRRPGELT